MTQPNSNWSDSDWNTFSTWLRDLLRTNTVTVTFIKSDGTERVMRCTLQPSVLPPQLNEGTKRKVSNTAVPVWDVDAGGWRSFTLRSVTRVEFSLGVDK